MPSEKYSLPLSSLRLANARTATDLALTSDLGIAEPAGVGWTAAFFLRESSSCNSSVIFLATALLMVSANEGDAVALGSGDVTSARLSSVRMLAGANMTDTTASRT